MSEVIPTMLELPDASALNAVLLEAAANLLREWLDQAKPGLCGRLDDLPAGLMSEVAAKLDGEYGGAEPRAHVRMLVTESGGPAWSCTWTEAVQLRNPDGQGNKRPPLMLLVPPGTQLMGSLDTDTFKAVSADGLVRKEVQVRLASLPAYLAPVAALLRDRQAMRCLSDVTRLRYLLAVERSGYDVEAAGLALCLLGYWPHRGWLTHKERDYQLTRNAQEVARLRAGTTSVLDRIYNLRLKSGLRERRLHDLLSSSGSMEQAAERAATDPAWADVDFGRWEFADNPTTVSVALDRLELPRNEEGVLVLRLREQPTLQLAWRTTPPPSDAVSLTHFVVELVRIDAEETVVVAWPSDPITPGKSPRKTYALKGLRPLVDARQLEEDLYRIRVTAWAKQTNITQEPEQGEDASNLSEPFWLLDAGDEAGTDIPPARQQTSLSFLHARRAVQWDLLAQGKDPWAIPTVMRTWDAPTDGKAVQHSCLVRTGRRSFRVRLSRFLRRAETRILSEPESLGALKVDLAHALSTHDAPIHTREGVPKLADDDPFLRARAEVFACIRGSDGLGLVETADLVAHRSEVVAYAREYVRLLQDADADVNVNPQLWPSRVVLSMLDSLRVALPGMADEAQVAVLLAPTHPLRMLWFLQLALLGDSWLREALERGYTTLPRQVRDALQEGLQSDRCPAILYDARRVSYLEAGQVAYGWDAYLPAEICDRPAALSRLGRALGCGVSLVGSPGRARDMGDRVLRYIEQHPYVSLLRLNVFNPGDGALLVDMLRKLDDIRSDLRYDIRLFTAEGVREDMGAALDDLVNPERSISERDEKYSQSSPLPLHPVLTYSKNTVNEFLEAPRRFEAHLSLVLEFFRPQVTVADAIPTAGADDLYGLQPCEVVVWHSGTDDCAWERQVACGTGPEISPGAEEAALLRSGLAALQSFTASLGISPSPRVNRVPTARLDLTIAGKNLLYEVHSVSDWVLTFDRYLGIDYYDCASPSDRADSPGILLDFAPEYQAGNAGVLMLTTKADEEITRLVEPTLARIGFSSPGCGRVVVEWLRSLSGRLAMRLMAEPAASQGVLGMALARAFLEKLGLLARSAAIPADAHIAVLASGVPEGEAQYRTDLILASCSATQHLDLALVEVKCVSAALGPGAFEALRDAIDKQTSATQTALTTLFDPHATVPDVIERPLRDQLLSGWLRFYAQRGRRYGLLDADAAQSLVHLGGCLRDSYTVSFRRIGLVFELGREADAEPSTGDVAIHRIGRASCERLMAGVDASQALPPSWDRVRATLRGDMVWTRGRVPDAAAGSQGGPVSSGVTDAAAPVLTHEHAVVPPPLPVEPECGVPSYRYLVGASKPTPQWGLLGRHGGEYVALDLDGCNTLSLFGVQGGGKSYTMGTILEMALRPIPGINVLPQPLAAVVFHYNDSQEYAPEFVTMGEPNTEPDELHRLLADYGASGAAIADLLILTPEDKVDQRRNEFPGASVEPILFHPGELAAQDWRFLMSAVGNDSMYVRELNLLMRGLRDGVTVEGLKSAITSSHLTPAQQNLALVRLRFAEQFVRDGACLRDTLRPGRLVVVDLRDELIETDEALGLFVVMLRVFAGATYEGRAFSKLIAFDEAHKYIRNTDLLDSVVSVIRQMRHQATSVLIASQDPPSLPLKVVELSSLVMLHRMDSPAWLKHIQKAVTPLGELTPQVVARLRPGEAYLWARSATDPMFTNRAVKVECRPRVTKHGGTTKTATG